MLDQASRLREIVKDTDENKSGTRIYSIISGKGGVGKRSFAIDLESKFLEMGKKVISLDMEKFNDLSDEEIIDSLLPLVKYEVVIINNTDGISEESLKYTKLANEVVLVTMPGVTAITETYKFLKVLNQEGQKEDVKILVNNKEDIENEDTFKNLKATAERFLNMVLEDITDMDRDKLRELLYDSDFYDDVELRDKIKDIFR